MQKPLKQGFLCSSMSWPRSAIVILKNMNKKKKLSYGCEILNWLKNIWFFGEVQDVSIVGMNKRES